MNFIDLNADLGEGFPHDEELLKMLSSCNIACGGHAGDINSMTQTILMAKKYDVNIGAHPSYPDKINFGRKEMDIDVEKLRVSLQKQMEDLINIASQLECKVTYVKPHGALYNKAMKDIETAEIILESVQQLPYPLALMGMSNSTLASLCQRNNIPFIQESFADRRYTHEGFLVPRSKSNAVIHDKKEVWEQINDMIIHQKIKSENGVLIPLQTDSICFHGDTLEALSLLNHVRQKLKENSIEVKSF